MEREPIDQFQQFFMEYCLQIKIFICTDEKLHLYK